MAGGLETLNAQDEIATPTVALMIIHFFVSPLTTTNATLSLLPTKRPNNS
jgi:hypothetical protein